MAKNSAKSVLSAPDKDWQAESDCDTLLRAADIRKDKARMKAAQEVAKRRLGALEDISDSQEPDNDEDD